MAIINFDQDEAYRIDRKSFFVLGALKPEGMTKTQLKELEAKLNKDKPQKTDKVWGTLGWENDLLTRFKGQIEFSDDGNFDSKGATLSIVKEIYSINPFLGKENNLVKELFINFDNMKLGRAIDFDRPNEMPRLRLTVFINSDEGAVAYLQHSSTNNYDEENAPLEFVMPEKDADDSTEGRDRITFYIPLDALRTRSEKFDIIGKTRISSFIVKILTFKRSVGTAEKLLQQAKDMLLAKSQDLSYKDDVGDYIWGRDKYAILKYNKNHDTKEVGGVFVNIDVDPIDFSKKTLLLIHGTFASVHGSFGNFFEKKYNNTYFLNKLLEDKVFEQIIAFNHPTVSENAQDNIEWFLKKLNGNKFKKPVSIVCASRGALVAKRMTDISNTNIVPVERVIMFSGANGVGWFNVGRQIARGLSIMKYLSTPGAGKMILSFLQFSADFFLKQKACVEMTPDSDELKELLSLTPQADTKFLNVVSDWDSSLPDMKLIGKMDVVLDLIIKSALGKEHDWVVSTKNQRIYFSHTKAKTTKPLQIVSMHCKYFDLDFTHANTHEIIYNYLSLS